MWTTKLLTGFAAAFALAGAASPGWARPDIPEPPGQVTVPVRVGDLNLSTEPGARDAFYRLRSAAEKVCGPEPVLQAIAQFQLYRACVEDTVGVAVASANQPLLASVAARYMHVNPTYLAAR